MGQVSVGLLLLMPNLVHDIALEQGCVPGEWLVRQPWRMFVCVFDAVLAPVQDSCTQGGQRAQPKVEPPGVWAVTSPR